MYNPSYVTSTLSIRYRTPVSYSFNDYSYDYRFSNHLVSSSQSCLCVCCSSSYVYGYPFSPRFVCGSKQSSLIQCSGSRRLLVQGGLDQCCFRGLGQDPCWKCSCGCVKETGFGGGMRDLGERRFKRRVSEGRSCDFETTEMMLSLLIEDVGDECYDVRERDYSLPRRLDYGKKGGEGEKKKNVKVGSLGSGSRSKYEGLRIESRENEERNRRSDNRKGGEEDFRRRGDHSSSRSKYEGSRVESRENEARNRRSENRKTEDEESFRRENRRGRSGSSCSSYYTCMSLGEDLETDSEMNDLNEAYGQEPSEGYGRNFEESENVVRKGEIKENLRRNEGVVGSRKMIESDWRKKTEKKLDDVAIGDVCETSHLQGSSSHKKFDIVDDKSKKFIRDSGTTQKYSQKSDQRDDYRFSTSKSNQSSKVEDISVDRTELSQYEYEDRVKRHDRFSGVFISTQDTEKRNYLEEDDSRQTDSRRKFQQSGKISDDRFSRRDDYRLSMEEADNVSQIEDVTVNRTNISQSQYEDKVKRQEDSYYLKTRNDDTRRKFQDSAQILDDRVKRRDDSKSDIEQFNQVSQMRRTNDSLAQYEDKVKRREDQSSVILSSVQNTEKRSSMKSEEDLRQMESRRKFRQSAEVSDDRISRREDCRSNTQKTDQVSKIKDINVNRTNLSGAQYEEKVKRRENRSSMISSSVQDTEYQFYLQSEEDSRKKLQRSTEISDDRVSQRDENRLRTKQSNQVSQIQDLKLLRINEDKVKRQEDQLSCSVQDTEHQYYLQSEEDLRQMDSRRKLQQSTEISATQVQDIQSNRQVSRKKESAKGSLEMSTSMISQSSDTQVVNVQKTSENRISSQKTFQSMEESQSKKEASYNRILRIGSINDKGDTPRKASTSQASLILETMPTAGDESNSQAILGTSQTLAQTKIKDDPLSSISHEDTLGSAIRFQKSCSKVVSEFLDKAEKEASTSESQIEKSTFKEDRVLESRKHEQKSSSEYEDADFKSKDKDSRRSSGSPGVKGPSDEMWDEVAPHIQESAGMQIQVPEKTSPSDNILVRRTGKSLWNVFSDIVRLRWSAHPKISSPKPSNRNSPNKTASEAFFSGHERDETSDENIKNGNKSMSGESIPARTESQVEEYSSSSSKDKISHSKTPIVSLSPKGSSSVSTEENLKIGGSPMMELSVSNPPSQIRRSPNVDDMSESDKRTTISVPSPIQVKETEEKVGSNAKRRMLQRTNQVIKDKFDDVVESDKRSTVSETEGRVGGDRKGRMFRRTNHVEKDKFDEWEEAFVLETEQRKIDEGFMKEALSEARKAGDMWEVPVGAVLVQHGKIIARGYNLVEELRDSTAHAEMICIREASNQLRSWRLADTTLYVTLEPCPMCAGAILQARVDTVVWGAPNKLLGADGSWIRLFPGGVEAGSSSEPTDKPPAPVHPFHPKITIRRGVLGTECAEVMQQFFQLRRRKKDKKQLPDIPPTPPSCLPITNHPTKILTRMQEAFHFTFCL